MTTFNYNKYLPYAIDAMDGIDAIPIFNNNKDLIFFDFDNTLIEFNSYYDKERKISNVTIDILKISSQKYNVIIVTRNLSSFVCNKIIESFNNISFSYLYKGLFEHIITINGNKIIIFGSNDYNSSTNPTNPTNLLKTNNFINEFSNMNAQTIWAHIKAKYIHMILINNKNNIINNNSNHIFIDDCIENIITAGRSPYNVNVLYGFIKNDTIKLYECLNNTNNLIDFQKLYNNNKINMKHYKLTLL